MPILNDTLSSMGQRLARNVGYVQYTFHSREPKPERSKILLRNSKPVAAKTLANLIYAIIKAAGIVRVLGI